MITNMQLTITGVKPSKFKVEDFTEDCVKVYALLPLDEETGGMGQASEAFNFKTSEEISLFKGCKFPFEANCKLELITAGKKSKLVLKEVTIPVAQVPAKA